jgi:hypothetical protein
MRRIGNRQLTPTPFALGSYGGYQGIWRQDDSIRYFGNSDPRKDGCAIGY